MSSAIGRSANEIRSYEMVANWQQRHVSALKSPKGFEAPILSLIEGLQDYRVEHEARYGSKIGEDHFMGKLYLDLARTIIKLLNGEIGRLDGGSVEQLVRRQLGAAGFTEDEIDSYSYLQDWSSEGTEG